MNNFSNLTDLEYINLNDSLSSDRALDLLYRYEAAIAALSQIKDLVDTVDDNVSFDDFCIDIENVLDTVE